MEPRDYLEYRDQDGRLFFSAFVHWQCARGPVHCLMQAVFLPGSRLKLFLAQLKTCPYFRGIFFEPAVAANSAWRLLEEHFQDLSPQRGNAPGRQPQETAFLASIGEDPDNDVTRLIFADWLEENGQPDKAAFVRLEVENSRLPTNEKTYERIWAEFSRLDQAIGGHWTLALIRPARNVDWVFLGGDFSSYDIGTPSCTVRYFLTLDSHRQWQHKKYDCVQLWSEEKDQLLRLANVPEVEADLEKLPRMPHPAPGEW
jgi:uncharacterized protein (TIGR02996 family)